MSIVAGYIGNGKELPVLIGQICALKENVPGARSLRNGECLAAEDRIFGSGRLVSAPEKTGHDNCLLKEIYEQPEAVLRTLGKRPEDTGSLLDELGLVKTARNLRRLHIVGCGSSYHAGLVGRYIIERFVHIPVGIDIASEFRCMEPIITKGTLFISISQSGDTTDTLEAQRAAKRKGAFTVTICNEENSACAREADSVLYTSAGRETGSTSTKNFTTQMAALCLLGIALGIGKERVNPLEGETLKALITDLPSLMKKTLDTCEAIRGISETLVHTKSCLYLGRGINYPVALEGALKLKELCHIFAEGFAAGEMRHGAGALIEMGVPVVLLAPVDSLHKNVLSDIAEVKARGGRVIAITDAPAALIDAADHLIPVPSTHPAFFPFLSVIPLQLLAYHLAAVKGYNADLRGNPARGLPGCRPSTIEAPGNFF
jgi:glucosamine--fructose-6-phosphate aminotransferase (isomerizing)